MGLADNKSEYNGILLLVKDCCKELGKVIRLACGRNEYLNSGRFPADWPITDIVKRYLRGQRKIRSRRNKEAAEAGNDNNSSESEGEGEAEGESEGEGEGEGEGSDSGGGEGSLSKAGEGRDEEEEEEDEEEAARPLKRARRN
ncbi:hypothetical protein BDZ97DRAFT_1935084 [Flammula alnicola]|nr:hypothetical protein BDZ97DRAFT_1935084 [Flammula alnicola]